MDQSAYPKLLLCGALVSASASIALVLYERYPTKLEQWPEQIRPFSGVPADLPSDMSPGQYLASAADCVACHTAPGGKPLAGGRAFRLPFGEIYSTNITSDKNSGIGGWTDDQFVDAVRRGVGSRGHLFPVMPYTAYIEMSRQDVLEIKKYLMTVEPVASEIPSNNLSFPFNQRWGMAIWSMAFFQDRQFLGLQERSYDWNRGAYLARALGRCAECRTTRNAGFVTSSWTYLTGSKVEGSGAYGTTQQNEYGMGGWTAAQIANYLAMGHVPRGTSARSPVEHSFQYLTPRDINAVVNYMATVPAVSSGTFGPAGLQPPASSLTSALIPGKK